MHDSHEPSHLLLASRTNTRQVSAEEMFQACSQTGPKWAAQRRWELSPQDGLTTWCTCAMATQDCNAEEMFQACSRTGPKWAAQKRCELSPQDWLLEEIEFYLYTADGNSTTFATSFWTANEKQIHCKYISCLRGQLLCFCESYDSGVSVSADICDKGGRAATARQFCTCRTNIHGTVAYVHPELWMLHHVNERNT